MHDDATKTSHRPWIILDGLIRRLKRGIGQRGFASVKLNRMREMRQNYWQGYDVQDANLCFSRGGDRDIVKRSLIDPTSTNMCRSEEVVVVSRVCISLVKDRHDDKWLLQTVQKFWNKDGLPSLRSCEFNRCANSHRAAVSGPRAWGRRDAGRGAVVSSLDAGAL